MRYDAVGDMAANDDRPAGQDLFDLADLRPIVRRPPTRAVPMRLGVAVRAWLAFAALAMIGAWTLPALADAPMRLRGDVTARGDVLTLGDLVENAPGSQAPRGFGSARSRASIGPGSLSFGSIRRGIRGTPFGSPVQAPFRFVGGPA
ncbi:hypothetical protein [Methylobacterium hispanicum]|uniref:hypothetical protein n=1 Tax=Methylobacterium hispanicum TaxID=270350 RepID=UPI002F30E86A